MNHNDYLFSIGERDFRFLRRFDDMYRNCEDPHGQSQELRRIDYQIVLAVLERALGAYGAASGRTRVLDVGCGLGYFTSRVQQLFPETQVSGCDISPTALEKARERAPQCDFFVMDLKERATLPPQRYDVLLAMHVLCYFTAEEIGEVLGNLNRLMSAGGFVLVGHHLPKQMNFARYLQSLDDARALFGAAGFTVRFSLDMSNELDSTYAGDAVGRNLYFLAQKHGMPLQPSE
jgi:SAM-dependent methyltransferase